MFTRSSFLLLGYFSCSASAAQCTMDESQDTLSASMPFSVCVTSSGYDCSEDCQKKLEQYASVAGSYNCTLFNGKTMKQAVDEVVELYGKHCGTQEGDETSGGGDQCTMDESQELASAAMDFNGGCVTASGFDCSEDCQNKMGEFASVAGSIDCEIDGTNTKNAMAGYVELYNTHCDTNVDASGAHGYSAAHYMLAILVPMALLCL